MHKLILTIAIFGFTCLNTIQLFAQASINNSCENAIPLTVGFDDDCEVNAELVNIEFNSIELVPSCYEEAVADAYYSFVVPRSGNVRVSTFGAVAIYDACNGISRGSVITGLPARENVILQYLQRNTPVNVELCLSESPDTPINDLCVNAIPLCREIVNTSNRFATENTGDPSTPSHCGLDVFRNRTVWYTFKAKNEGSIYVDIRNRDCDGGAWLDTSIFSASSCDGPFTMIDCDKFSNTTLGISKPVPGETYYILVAGNSSGACEFDIHISSDEETNFSFSPACEFGDSDNFYVDITVNDLGDNPSGYKINGGRFSDITGTGTFRVGPYSNGQGTVLMKGIDEPSCAIRHIEDFSCLCDPLSVTASEDITICSGEPAEIKAVSEEVIKSSFLGSYFVNSSSRVPALLFQVLLPHLSILVVQIVLKDRYHLALILISGIIRILIFI